MHTILLIGAVARLTRLITTDQVFAVLRNRLGMRGGAIAYLATCDWCVSIYFGFAVFTVAYFTPDVIIYIAAGALTASLVAGWLGLFEAQMHSILFGDDDD